MKVAIFFASRTDNPIRNAMIGRYVGGGFLFVENSETSVCKIDAFYSRPGEEFYRRDFSVDKWRSLGFELEFLMLSVDEEEAINIRKTCEACQKAHKQYSIQDMLLMLLPFRDPKEISLFDAETLNNVQAIILILRECLNPDNPLRLALQGLNSRATFIVTVYDRFAPYTLPVLWSNLVKLT
jgi:hypothetical protein